MKSAPLSDVDVARMVSELKYPFNLLFYLGVKTGLRISELLSIKDCDLIEKTGEIKKEVYIPRRNVKGKITSRYVKLNTASRCEIAEMVSGKKFTHGYLFPLSRFTVYREFERIRKKLGIETKVATHGMRKSFAVKVYALSGKDIVMTQKALGHSSVNSTIYYLEVDAGKLNEILEQI